MPHVRNSHIRLYKDDVECAEPRELDLVVRHVRVKQLLRAVLHVDVLCSPDKNFCSLRK